jgi:hypothetical protein
MLAEKHQSMSSISLFLHGFPVYLNYNRSGFRLPPTPKIVHSIISKEKQNIMVRWFALIVLGLGLDSTRAFSTSTLYHHRGKATTQRSTILLATTTATVAINDSLDNKKNDPTETAGPTSSSSSTSHNNDAAGPYRKFAEYAWQRLTALEYLQDAKIEPQLQSNRSAVHPKDGSSVYMTVRALTGSPTTTSPIRYARYALLETQQVPMSTADTAASTTTVNAAGSTIQVLNLVVFPNSDLPVWGADFVSLPGNKHLLLLDAQPMPKMVGSVGDDCDYSQHWEEWYQSHDIAATFPWGGDLPEQVQPFVSKFALWSRLGGGGAPGTVNTPDAVRAMMEGPLYEAYCDHLDRYLHLVASSSSSGNDDQSSASTTARIGDYHGQRDYIAYRLANDPARPMLKRLFGEEWTEQVLENVLFPQS